MFIPKKKTEPTALDIAIDNLVSELAGYDANSEEYTAAAANLKVLVEAKALEPKPNVVSADTIAVIAGNLLGIVMILGFEKANVITSKSLGFVMKPRV